MAKRFQFSLQTLLRVRELREQEAQRRLADQQAAVAQVETAIAQNWQEIRATQGRLAAAQNEAALDPTALARGRAWVAHLRNVILQNEQHKAVLSGQLAELRDQWLEARKQRRVLQQLRERRWEQYRRHVQREEQAVMDEVAQQLHTRESGWPGTPQATTPPRA